jgi:hypothetical protein
VIARAAFARRASAPRVASLAGAAIVALTVIASAQIGGKPATGNPTPGTAQPDPPKPADRVTYVGCLQRATGATTTGDPNTPTNSRFELTRAEPVKRVPPGTAPADGPARGSSKTYRLEGIDSIFSPFVGARVEITGEVKPPSAAEKAAAPTLVVEFLQRIAAQCS